MFYESRIDYELALHGWKLATLRLDRSIFIVLCNIRFSALFQVQSGERILIDHTDDTIYSIVHGKLGDPCKKKKHITHFLYTAI